MSWSGEQIKPRVRVITDNDYAGDPDGLIELAHHLLSPGVDLRYVVGGQLASLDPDRSPTSADDSAAAAAQIADLTGRDDVTVLAGANDGLTSRGDPQRSAASEALIAEAMRDDTDVPLVVACGGSLTNIASAWLQAPTIAERLTLIWIGGKEHPGLGDPRFGLLPFETNTSIDFIAAQVVFNDSNLRIWQVPWNVYGTVLTTRSELLGRMRPHGALGEHLFDAISREIQRLNGYGFRTGEGYCFGDSPLVLLTALTARMNPNPASSSWVSRPRRTLSHTGDYGPECDGPPLRVFTQLDTRAILEDFFWKLATHARSPTQPTD